MSKALDKKQPNPPNTLMTVHLMDGDVTVETAKISTELYAGIFYYGLRALLERPEMPNALDAKLEKLYSINSLNDL